MNFLHKPSHILITEDDAAYAEELKETLEE